MSAWATNSEPTDADKNKMLSEDAFPTMGAVPLKKKDDEDLEMYLGLGGGGKKGGGKKKKDKGAKMSLNDFVGTVPSPYATPFGATALHQLPTRPRERDPDEEIDGRGNLGGAFKDYGGDRGGGGFRGRDDDRNGPRVGGFDREERPRRRDDEFAGPSRSDEDSNWGASKKFVPSGPPARDGPMRRRDDDRGEREMSGPSRADEDDNWGKSKKFVPSGPPERDGPRRDDREGPRGPSKADTESNWGASKKTIGRDDDYRSPPVGERPRLQLAKRTVPIETPEPAPAPAADKPSPFGGARPVTVAEKEAAPAPEKEKAVKAPPPERPSDRDWNAARAERARPADPQPAPTAERPKLNLKPRTVEEPPAVPSGASKADVFGGARPREMKLEEQGRDWRKEEVELARKGIVRPETEKETELKSEIEALREKLANGDGAQTEEAESLKLKEAELVTLCQQLDDKVRFATGGEGHGKKKAGEPRKPAEKKDVGERKEAAPAPKEQAPQDKPAPAAPKVSEDGWEEAKPRKKPGKH
uniref:Eukaryotic translation initiation factor 4B1 n=1 Tax=Pyramimonas obovata TaxID=1411642 RepID=A0A7S0RAV5_9CHLO